MAQNILIPGYGTYNDVPSIIFPQPSITVVESNGSAASINVSNNAGDFGYYGSVSGVPSYDHQAVIAIYDDVTYTLPQDPDPGGYAAGYIGYGATIEADRTNFSTYPIRVEQDDNDTWRLYNQAGGTHTLLVKTKDSAKFSDTSPTTAVAGDVASGKQFLDAEGNVLTGSGSGSQFTKIYTGTTTISNFTTTTATSHTTISLGSSAYDSDSILYVKIRDAAGMRNNYFLGSDSYCFNYNKANNGTSSTSYWVKNIHRKASGGAFSTYTAGTSIGYGLYPYSISSTGTLTLYKRYSSSYSLTIDGTYNIEVYKISYVGSQANPYDFSSYSM